MSAKKPTYPTRKLQHVTLLGQGRARSVNELLPDDKEAQELVIATKFAETVNQKFGRDIHSLKNAPTPLPDVEAIENGQPIYLELRRLSSADEERRYQILMEYAQQLAERVSICLPTDTLIRLQITDQSRMIGDRSIGDYLDDFPRTGTPSGERIVKALVQLLCDKKQAIEELELSSRPSLKAKTFLNLDWTGLRGRGPFLSLMVWRNPRFEEPLVEWAAFSYSHDELQSRLTNAISDKSKKNYPAENHNILLLWEVMPPFSSNDSQIESARALLADLRHPFDEIWYFFPIAADSKSPNSSIGAAKRII